MKTWTGSLQSPNLNYEAAASQSADGTAAKNSSQPFCFKPQKWKELKWWSNDDELSEDLDENDPNDEVDLNDNLFQIRRSSSEFLIPLVEVEARQAT